MTNYDSGGPGRSCDIEGCKRRGKYSTIQRLKSQYGCGTIRSISWTYWVCLPCRDAIERGENPGAVATVRAS